MDILKKAAERAILPKEDGYVMNDIYFGEEGLTSTSANHVSAMANVMVNDLKQHINGLRLCILFAQLTHLSKIRCRDQSSIGDMFGRAIL